MDYKELEKLIMEKLSQGTMDAIRQQKKRQDPEAAERIEKFQQTKSEKRSQKKTSTQLGQEVAVLQIPKAASAGSRSERAEHYLIMGILENKLRGIHPKQPFKFSEKQEDEDYISRAIKIGLDIGQKWNGPSITEENTKVLGAEKGELTPSYAAIGANPTSVTDVIIGGLKCSIKEAGASQVTLLEPGNYPLVFDYCYTQYKDGGGKIDLSKKIEGIVPADFQKKMIDTVLRDYAQAFTAKDSGGEAGKGRKRGNLLNAIFSFKQEKNVSLEAQQELIAEVLETYTNAPEVNKVFEKLVALYQSLFQDVKFKTLVVKELLTGGGKFAKGSSAVPTHMFFFSIKKEKYKIIPINEEYLSANLDTYKWGARAGKGNVYKTVDKVRTFSKKRLGAIRVDQVDVSDKLANQLNVAGEVSEVMNEEVINFLIQEGILSKVGKGLLSLAKKAWSIIPAPLIEKAKEIFKKLVSSIVDIANNTFRSLLSAFGKEPVKAFEEDALEFEKLDFTPEVPALDNQIDAGLQKEHLTINHGSYNMLVEMVENLMSKE